RQHQWRQIQAPRRSCDRSRDPGLAPTAHAVVQLPLRIQSRVEGACAGIRGRVRCAVSAAGEERDRDRTLKVAWNYPLNPRTQQAISVSLTVVPADVRSMM